MSAFAENPFFFFVDNAQPIFPVNICNDGRKIVEVTDVGCDAIPPSPAFQRNNDRHFRNSAYGVAPNAEKWRWHREEPYYSTNNFSGGKFEEYKRQNVRNVQGIRSVPTKNGSNYSRYWQKSPGHQDYMSYEKVRRPVNREFSVNREESIKKRSKIHNYDRNEKFGNVTQNPAEFSYNTSNRYFQNKANTLRDEYPFEFVEGTEYVNEYSNLDTIDIENDCRNLAREDSTQQQAFVEETYPETFDNNLRNYTRSRRDRWKKYVPQNEKHLEQPYSGYYPKFSKVSNECDVSNDVQATIDSRIRSRTRSPPQDRHKRTKSFTKPTYNNEDLKNENNSYAYKNSQNIDDNVDKVSPSLTKQNIGAENSADSMKNLFVYTADCERFNGFLKTSSTSITDCISAANVSTADVPTLKNEQRNTFWEFIPLGTDAEKKCSKVTEKLKNTVHPSDRNRPIKSTVSKNEDHKLKVKRSNKIREASNNAQNCFIPSVKRNMEKWKDRLNGTCNSTPSKRPKACSAIDDKMHRINTRHERPFSAAPVLQKVQNPQKLTSTNRKVSSTKNVNSMNFSQNSATNLTSVGHSSKIHVYPENGKLQNKFSDSVDKFNQSKRVSSFIESNVDKKKIVENIITAGDKKKKMSFVEKTAARLKRKLDSSKPGIGANLNERGTEQKFHTDGSVYSKLPIRIGNRLRSKEPRSLNDRNLKADVFEKDNKDSLQTSENSNQGSSERSRTKPKIRSNLRQKENLKTDGANCKIPQGN